MPTMKKKRSARNDYLLQPSAAPRMYCFAHAVQVIPVFLHLMTPGEVTYVAHHMNCIERPNGTHLCITYEEPSHMHADGQKGRRRQSKKIV